VKNDAFQLKPVSLARQSRGGANPRLERAFDRLHRQRPIWFCSVGKWILWPMNRSTWLARLLGLGGVLETVTGLGLLVDPAGGASALFGAPVEGSGVVIGRIGGAGLLSLGIACWLARKTPMAPASVGVAWAYLAYNAVACVTLAWAGVTLGGASLPAQGAAVLHGVLGTALLVALLGRGQASAGS